MRFCVLRYDQLITYEIQNRSFTSNLVLFISTHDHVPLVVFSGEEQVMYSHMTASLSLIWCGFQPLGVLLFLHQDTLNFF